MSPLLEQVIAAGALMLALLLMVTLRLISINRFAQVLAGAAIGLAVVSLPRLSGGAHG